jgi:hypothetical protein
MQDRHSCRPNLDFYRKSAKDLLRAFDARQAEALARAERILGRRANDRFLLSDAQHVLAVEHGHRSWAELKQAVEAASLNRESTLRAQLVAVRSAWGERGEVVLDTGLSYAEGEPVQALVRKRGGRYYISDLGAAVELAGRPRGWLEVAERVVEEAWLNVNRRGVVFVPAVEGRDHAELAIRVGDTSLSLYQALLELFD